MLQPLHKKVKRALFEEINDIAWSGREDLSRWCQQNKVFNEITEDVIAEIWNRESNRTRKKQSD